MIYLTLFIEFLKVGAFTFGGGYAMISIIQQTVLANGWLDAKTVVDFVALSESTPGPIAVNMATFVGKSVGGAFGAVVATLGVVLPSFVVILILCKCFDRFRKSKAVNGCMSGIKPAVIGLVASALITVGRSAFDFTAFKDPMLYLSLGIFLLCTALAFKKVHPIIIIIAAAVLGIAFGYIL